MTNVFSGEIYGMNPHNPRWNRTMSYDAANDKRTIMFACALCGYTRSDYMHPDYGVEHYEQLATRHHKETLEAMSNIVHEPKFRKVKFISGYFIYECEICKNAFVSKTKARATLYHNQHSRSWGATPRVEDFHNAEWVLHAGVDWRVADDNYREVHQYYVNAVEALADAIGRPDGHDVDE